MWHGVRGSFNQENLVKLIWVIVCAFLACSCWTPASVVQASEDPATTSPASKSAACETGFPVSEDELKNESVYFVLSQFQMQGKRYAVLRSPVSEEPRLYQLNAVKLGNSKCVLVQRSQGKARTTPYGGLMPCSAH